MAEKTTVEASIGNSPVLDDSRVIKETGGVHDHIAKSEGEDFKKAVEANLGSVTLEDWGTFFKLPSGGWKGLAGNYGPTTELGRKLESAFANQQQSQEGQGK